MIILKIRNIVIWGSIVFLALIGSTITQRLRANNYSVTQHVLAQSADDFVESMGISTKFGFCPGRLCDNYPEVKALLAELGIRYIRDIPFPEQWRRRTDLYEDHGIRMLAETGRTAGQTLDTENISARLDIIKSWGNMIAGIVGINEYDSAYNSCERDPEGCDPNWSEQNWPRSYRLFQQRLYEQVKTDQELHHLPVIMGPMVNSDNLERLGNLNGICDKGNDHTYPFPWGKPSQESEWFESKDRLSSIDEMVAKVQKVCPGKKLWITETGYREKIYGEKIDAQQNKYKVTRKAKTKYLPRIYANYYLQGQIEKTFLYVLLAAVPTDLSGHGIVDANLQPTPAYYGIKNMTSLLGEATWDRLTQSWQYPDFQPSSLEYTLKGNLTDIKHLLLQKSDGTFYLLLWQEVYTYDAQQGKDIENPDRPIQFKLNGGVIKKANKYLFYNETNPSAELDPLETWTNVSNLSLSVPDHILVLEFALKD